VANLNITVMYCRMLTLKYVGTAVNFHGNFITLAYGVNK